MIEGCRKVNKLNININNVNIYAIYMVVLLWNQLIMENYS